MKDQPTIREIATQNPALVFLDRSMQLSSLQQRIIGTMVTDVRTESADHDASFEATTVTPSPQAIAAYTQNVLDGLAKSRRRWAEIQLMFQLFFCRQVDDFQTFLEHLLGGIAVYYPTLVSRVKIKKSVNHLTPLEQRSLQLRRLSFLSIRELREAIDPDFVLFPTEEAFSAVDRIYDLRNLYTHSYGVVDEHFLRKHSEPQFILGSVVQLDHNFIRAVAEVLLSACRDIHERATSTFHVKWSG